MSIPVSSCIHQTQLNMYVTFSDNINFFIILLIFKILHSTARKAKLKYYDLLYSFTKISVTKILYLYHYVLIIALMIWFACTCICVFVIQISYGIYNVHLHHDNFCNISITFWTANFSAKALGLVNIHYNQTCTYEIGDIDLPFVWVG